MALRELLSLLPNLRVVLLLGAKAGAAGNGQRSRATTPFYAPRIRVHAATPAVPVRGTRSATR